MKVANPDLLLVGDTYHLYFRGQQDGHDRIGVATISREKFDGSTWDIRPQPVIDVGASGDWDEGAIWFTTAEKIGGRYYLWYEGYGGGDSRTKEYGSYLLGAKSQIGLAIMDPT